MTRAICAGLLLLLAISSACAMPWPWTAQPITVCYQTDGQQVTTAYIDNGAISVSSAYPYNAGGSVEQTDMGFIVRHETVFERLEQRVYLPGVSR